MLSITDNQNEGRALGRMYSDARCNMVSATIDSGVVVSPGTQYLVVPLPEVNVRSFYLCPQDGS